jgi:hypothetical protein
LSCGFMLSTAAAPVPTPANLTILYTDIGGQLQKLSLAPGICQNLQQAARSTDNTTPNVLFTFEESDCKGASIEADPGSSFDTPTLVSSVRL